MINYIQPGEKLVVVTPSGGLSSGDPVQIGKLFGVAVTDADAGDDVTILCEGVFTLPKDSSVPTQGAPAYWDTSAGKVSTSTDSAANDRVGVFTEAAVTGAATASVKISGFAE